MTRGPVLTCVLAALVFTGCGRAPSAPAGPPAGAGLSPATPPADPTGAGKPDAGMADAGSPDAGSPQPLPALPPIFVVSTNEPFWQARVGDSAVVLDGPDVAGRRFAIEREEPGEGARVVHARDAAGTIVVRLTRGSCQDSMSGAEFPYAGELVVDGVGPTRGCARPADMPPPRPPEG